ncbi:MAG: DMT family transporter [Promethearchaeota archaeon]
MMLKAINNEAKGFILIMIGIFFWSTIEITLKLIQAELDPLPTNFWRLSIGGIILLIISYRSATKKAFRIYLKTYYKYYIIASILGMVLGQIIYIQGTQMTNSAYAATIFSSNPIIISLYAIFFFKEEKNIKKVIGIFIGFLGTTIIITDLNFEGILSAQYLIGNILVFVGMCLWSIDVIIGKKISNIAKLTNLESGHESLFFNAITFFVAACTMIPLMYISGDFNKVLSYSIESWIGLLYLGAITGALAYFLFFQGINMIDASEGINAFYFKPIYATILTYFIFPNIKISKYFILGFIIEMIALYLVTSKKKT